MKFVMMGSSGGATGYARYALAYPAAPASIVLYIGISYNV
jgi:hypothetical protein